MTPMITASNIALNLANATPDRAGDKWAGLFAELGRFGIELETAGLSRGKCAEVITNTITSLNIDCWNLGYEVEMADGRKWSLMSDCSICTIDGYACEVVSPILTRADLPTVIAIVNALVAAGAKVNDSCGMHVHVDGAPFLADLKRLHNLVKLTKCFDGVIRTKTLRNRAQWCSPLEGSKITALLAAKSHSDFKTAWYGCDSRIATRRSSDHYDCSRYVGLNLHALWQKGTVEFRYFNGTLDPVQVVANVMMCLHMAARTKKLSTPKATSAERFFHLIRLTGKGFQAARKALVAA